MSGGMMGQEGRERRRRLVLHLSPAADNARLLRAAQEAKRSPESVAYGVIRDWLNERYVPERGRP